MRDGDGDDGGGDCDGHGAPLPLDETILEHLGSWERRQLGELGTEADYGLLARPLMRLRRT
jgi:hypothetical protein